MLVRCIATMMATIIIKGTQGRWFSPGTSASSTTKTGRHDIAEILLKVALNSKNKIQSNQFHPTVFVLIIHPIRK
jgi:hypothetical protein